MISGAMTQLLTTVPVKEISTGDALMEIGGNQEDAVGRINKDLLAWLPCSRTDWGN